MRGMDDASGRDRAGACMHRGGFLSYPRFTRRFAGQGTRLADFYELGPVLAPSPTNITWLVPLLFSIKGYEDNCSGCVHFSRYELKRCKKKDTGSQVIWHFLALGLYSSSSNVGHFHLHIRLLG